MNNTSFGEKFITFFSLQHGFDSSSSEINVKKSKEIAQKIIDKNITAMKYLEDK